ncbi:MAG: protein translocase subunit SecF [Thermodesulfobacteriota bacterium]|nr:protein translocase subunit SecF [Thermodesulfobacteriota bacterium]
MQFIKPDININFIGKKNIGFFFSLTLIIISFASLLIHHGPNYGIDFAGGTLVQVKFSQETATSDIRSALTEIGLANSSVQSFGKKENHEYLIRTSIPAMTGENLSLSIAGALDKATGEKPEIRRVEMVGPQVGKDLRKQALLAMFYSLLFITVYISGRFEMKWMVSGITAGALMSAVYFLSIFNLSMPIIIPAAVIVTLILFWFLELKYAMGAIIAILHDIIITVGIFSILDLEFSLPIIAALLTIIGYSLNDTIIVFDRIRENTRQTHKKSMFEIINKSINETLSRTILTSLTTLIVLFSLFFLGGEIIHNFTFAMITGILIGTYSSIFVASPILLAWSKKA